MNKKFILSIPALFLLVFGGFLSDARGQVTSLVSPPALFVSGKIGTAAFKLISPDTVDGINGEIIFDTYALSNPSVTTAAGAPGFTAQGNLVSPGKYRFVLYKNPPDTVLDLTQPVINFNFDVLSNLVGTYQTQSDFTIAAAARILPAPPGTVISIGVGGPGGNPAPAAVNFRSIPIPIEGFPLITGPPLAQTARVGQNVSFVVLADGLGQPFAYQWSKDGGGSLGTMETLTLNGVTTADAGTYSAVVTNEAGPSTSTGALLTVLEAADNDARYLSKSFGNKLPVGRTFTVGFTMKNISQLSWSSTQNYILAIKTDTDNLFNGATILSISDTTAVVPPQQVYQFVTQLTVPATPGTYSADLQMGEIGVGYFGDAVHFSFDAVVPPNGTTDSMFFE